MGAIKSLTHNYTDSQYLFWYIEKNDTQKIQELLRKKPNLVHQNISIQYNTHPLHRAATNGNLGLVKLLVQKFKANVNLQTKVGQTALMAAVKRNRIEIVKYLISNEADLSIISGSALNAIDFAILQGFYEISLLLYSQMKEKQIKEPQEYADIAKKYKYRYVNYERLLGCLVQKIDPENVGNFLKKQKKIYEDPVIDPRQTWKAWLARNIEFKDPPIVERSELPQKLQPQNRNFASLRHVITKLTISPLVQRPSLQPRNCSEPDSDYKLHQIHQISSNTEKIEIKSCA